MKRKFIQSFIPSSIVLLACLFFIGAHAPQASAASWSTITLDSVGNVGEYNSVKIGTDGFPRISYFDQTNGSLKYIRCKNVDCSSKTVTTVDTGNVGSYTSIAIGQDGFARISYKDNSVGLKFARCQNDDCTTKVLTTAISDFNGGTFSSLAIGQDGFARITSSNSSAVFLFFTQCQNANCSSPVTTNPDASSDFTGPHNSLAIAPDGFARISYRDLTYSNVKYMQCQNADCSTNITTTIASPAAAQAISLAIGTDGFARISYTASLSGGLVLAKCQNNDCSSKTTATLDSINAIGSSLVLNNDIPNVSYVDFSGSNLYFAQCTTPSCTGVTRDIVESSVTVGQWDSLALTGNNRYISYYDDTNDDLKLAMYIVPSTPTPTPSQNNTSSGGGSPAMPTAPLCTALAPSNAPNLFQIKTTKTSATLYFAPVNGSISSYFVSYGYQSGDNRFGVEFPYGTSSGVVSYTLQALAPNNTYYVRVRGGNGCMPGMWSNEMKFTTNGKTVLLEN